MLLAWNQQQLISKPEGEFICFGQDGRDKVQLKYWEFYSSDKTSVLFFVLIIFQDPGLFVISQVVFAPINIIK